MRSAIPAPVKQESAFSKNSIIQELTKSPHGELDQYLVTGKRAVLEHGEFFAHLISWNRTKGAIRDSKVALPVISLSAGRVHEEFSENALAHLATLDPRNLVRALRFGKTIKTPGYGHDVRRLVERYLRARESNWGKWERTAIQHRSTLKELYTLYHVKPSSRAEDVLFKGVYPQDSTFAIIANLRNMAPAEAAGEIIDRKIPFLIAAGALGAKAKDTDLLMALIGRMSPTELVTNMKRLEKLGVKNDPALRAALEEALRKSAGSTANVLKTSVAAEAVEDEGIAEKLRGLQEKQLDKMHSLDGNWIILADRSGSMRDSIEIGKHVAATLARLVKGAVHLAFFDTDVRHVEATGKSLDAIMNETKHINSGGATCIGSGLQYALDSDIVVGGIVVISDGGENRAPAFADRYQAYVKKFQVEPTVYFYRVAGDPNVFTRNCQAGNVQLQEFDLTGGVDYYSIPSIVQTMRTNRYSLVDEIMGVPLLTLDKVLGAA